MSAVLVRLAVRMATIYIKYIRYTKTSQMDTCVFVKTTLCQVVLSCLFKKSVAREHRARARVPDFSLSGFPPDSRGGNFFTLIMLFLHVVVLLSYAH